ncbi:AsmA family protein [Leeuwenhoekiella marinoflava]|uniref:AsmA-like protein n=2 Tax=Leeuwenhoekiella marinoflava TaxID=988 RepID=A0A4Q0PP37_9FLAO|nr:AsmA-like C-terminal region-containing protein [Leeuwenhoekiella marinoflava]RXG32221.1 AsmA-like protein [Leeuwenhoekiella marinoflava]SHE82916.1 AsmA-like C-terminal region [Leeuwenhoekiella marinoflava DSM 3653]
MTIHPITKKNKPKSTKRLRRLGLILGLIILVPIGLFILGWQSRNLIVNGLQEWYNANHEGTLEIGDVEANFLTGFPNVGFTINDISQSERDTISFKRKSIVIDKALVTISASDLIRGDFQFKNITINNASIYSEMVSDKSYDYHIKQKLNKLQNHKASISFPSWIDLKATSFRIKELKYVAKDSIFHKDFNLEFYNIRGQLKKTKSLISGSFSFEASINKLGFNTQKGSFLKSTEVSGKPKFSLDTNENVLNISEFILSIDDERFTISSSFNLLEPAYHINLSNDNLKFGSLQKFLSDSIAKKIAPFVISNPIQTSLTLDGLFQFKNTPEINARFKSTANTASYNDKYTLSNTNFKGYLTNKIYISDSIQSKKGTKEDIKIFFKEVTGNLEGMELKLDNSYYQSTPEYPNYVAANLNIEGKNESLAQVLKNDDFDFKGGNFELNTKVRGDIDHLEQLFNFAEGSFLLNNTQVILKKNGLQLPVKTIKLSLANKKSFLEELSIELEKSENLVFTGYLNNISSLISNNPLEPTSSFVELKSGYLNVDELISTAKKMIPESDKNKDDRKNINQILTAVFHKFQPRFKLKLDHVVYNAIQYQNLSSDIQLTSPEIITINDFYINYQKSKTNLKGNLIVPRKDIAIKQPLHLNVQAKTKGPIAIFQDLFDIKLVDIRAGNFDFSGNVSGNIQEFNQLLNKARGILKLKNASFYYPNAGFDIDFDSLSVNIANSNIILDQVELEVGALHPFVLNGNIKNFTNILLDNQETKSSVFLNIKAPFVDGDQWMGVVNSFSKKNVLTSETKSRELSKAFKDINRLQPQVSLNIDSLKYKGLITKDVDASVYFENDSILKLDHLKINYKNSRLFLKGTIQSLKRVKNAEKKNPFDFKFEAKASGNTADLNDYLKTVNFIFESGKFEFTGDYHGEASDLAVFNTDAIGTLKLVDSKVNFPLAGIQIPIDSLRLEIKNDFANLETLTIDLPSKSTLNVSGSINNFSDFINNSIENEEHISTFDISSPYLDTADLVTFFDTSKKTKDTSDKKPLKIQNLKDILNTINDSYYPQGSITIDTLIHKNLRLTDFDTYLLFDNTENLKIQKSDVDFYDGKLHIEALANISEPKHLPVTITIEATNLDLKKIVEGLDYFKNENLKNTDKLGGLINFNLQATGMLNDDGTLNSDSLNGELQLNLQNLTLHNYKPLMESVVLLKEDRFEELEFRPIVQTFKVVNGEIIIPRTEFQSSAIQAFAEGKIKLDEYVNIWLSIPWKNLKANEGLSLPKKTSFEEAGAKFYINLVQDQESKKKRKQKLRFKIKLWNSKLKRSKE